MSTTHALHTDDVRMVRANLSRFTRSDFSYACLQLRDGLLHTINLYRKFGREDYDQPHLYHLVLNMTRLDMEKASDLVCKLIDLKAKSGKQDPDKVL